MAEDQNPKFTRWNLRPFPEDIKRECNSRAAKEGKKDWKWLADYLRKVLPVIETSEVDSAHEGSKEEIRRSSGKAPESGTTKTKRGKTSAKA
jgi:hypothetical protein